MTLSYLYILYLPTLKKGGISKLFHVYFIFSLLINISLIFRFKWMSSYRQISQVPKRIGNKNLIDYLIRKLSP